MIAFDGHELLAPRAFVTEYDAPLGDLESPEWLVQRLTLDVDAPFAPDDAVKSAVRAALRTHGYKPSGRGKPASEYLIRAAEDGSLGSINLAVNLCNVASLHSGFPISVVDHDKLAIPLRIGIPDDGASYVFNPGGQEIRLDGLPCLFDAVGPCANAVRDSQRTKTSDATIRTLSVIWGMRNHEKRLEEALRWYREMTSEAGGRTTEIQIR
jgi:DNA/RNA-binding domain of Phe-tRNA-synthetase-like protein